MSRAIHAKEIVLFARRSQRRQLSHWPRSTFVPPESNPVHNPAAKNLRGNCHYLNQKEYQMECTGSSHVVLRN
ncbi:hypothetical protein DTO164E3_5781 [Paecilomyces variotii]|nr:hypothetical protein DTO164E3_5781 [Paecilomyces variotii]KAJ9319356.1 hypothetical protein DTO271D3_125 [Paecilomyces variotii]KAJ9410055.1 hypothetical protein DTO045G8_2048 [Paecilomyces variotii]